MSMIDFPFLLLFLTIASGVIWLVDSLFFAKKRKIEIGQKQAKLPILADYAKSLFPVFLVVFILRSFVGQLFVVPTGSLEPTVKPGDYILVTQFPYGIHFPVWNNRIIKIGEPKLGDVVVFHWPVNPDVHYIKRVVGVPGDTVSYINKILYIDGKEQKQTLIDNTQYSDPGLPKWNVEKKSEDLMGVIHDIYICPASSLGCPGHTLHNFYNLIIPKGEYLMMGDNRDDSDDSRYWGLVPTKDIEGRAELIVLSWNSSADWLHKIRWVRIGNPL